MFVKVNGVPQYVSVSEPMLFDFCILLLQIVSGDTVIIRGQPRGGPPPTRTLTMSKISAPRLARRANPNVEGSLDTVDEVSWIYFLVVHGCLKGKAFRRHLH